MRRQTLQRRSHLDFRCRNYWAYTILSIYLIGRLLSTPVVEILIQSLFPLCRLLCWRDSRPSCKPHLEWVRKWETPGGLPEQSNFVSMRLSSYKLIVTNSMVKGVRRNTGLFCIQYLVRNIEPPPPLKKQTGCCQLKSIAMPGIEEKEEEVGVRPLKLHRRHPTSDSIASQVFVWDL